MLAKAAFVALAAVYLSLNAPVVFNWSLLTLGYTSHAFVILFLVAAWWGYRHARAWHLVVLFAAAMAMDIVADDVGLITSIAAMLALVVFGLRDYRRGAALKASMTMLAAYGVYYLVRASMAVGYISRAELPAYASGAGGPEPGVAERLQLLVHHAGQVVSRIGIPLIAPVAHRAQLRWMLGDAQLAGEIAILLVVLVLHGWFWWRAWCGRRNAISFMAIALMWMFYGLVAATLIVRVSLYGPGYLWVSRYVLIYIWNVLALLLMAISQLPRLGETTADARAIQPAGRIVMGLVLVVLLGLQVPMSLHTWQGVTYRSVYLQRRAAWLDALAQQKPRKATHCAIGSDDCGNYVSVARFLRSHQLSVYSRKFRLRNRLYPSQAMLPSGPPDARARRALSSTSSM
jgi:hypothetical protein